MEFIIMETVVYIRVPASEVPEVDKFGLSENLHCFYKEKETARIIRFYDAKDQKWHYSYDGSVCENTTHYLKPVPLSSLLQEGVVEFAEWARQNYDSTHSEGWRRFGTVNYFTTTELFNSPEFKKHLEEKYGK
jgi:hypothetical protein